MFTHFELEDDQNVCNNRTKYLVRKRQKHFWYSYN